MTVIGLITNNDEAAYRKEVQNLTTWCTDNNLFLNTKKIKEIIVDFRTKKKTTHSPAHINSEAVEPVSASSSWESKSQKTSPGPTTPRKPNRDSTSSAK